MQTIPPFPGSHDARSSTDDANVHTLREMQDSAPSGNINSVTANTKDRVGSSGPATLGKRASNGEDPDPNGNDGQPKQIGIEEPHLQVRKPTPSSADSNLPNTLFLDFLPETDNRRKVSIASPDFPGGDPDSDTTNSEDSNPDWAGEDYYHDYDQDYSAP